MQKYQFSETIRVVVVPSKNLFRNPHIIPYIKLFS